MIFKAQREQDQKRHDNSIKCPGLFVLYLTTNFKVGKQIIERAYEQASLIHLDGWPFFVIKRDTLCPGVLPLDNDPLDTILSDSTLLSSS